MREVPRRLELHPDALRDPARSVSDAHVIALLPGTSCRVPLSLEVYKNRFGSNINVQNCSIWGRISTWFGW